MLKGSLLILATVAWVPTMAVGAPAGAHTHASAAAKAKCAKPHPARKAHKSGIASARAVAPRMGLPREGSIFSLSSRSLLAP